MLGMRKDGDTYIQWVLFHGAAHIIVPLETSVSKNHISHTTSYHSLKRPILCLMKVMWHDLFDEIFRTENAKGKAVRLPSNDVLVVVLFSIIYHRMQLPWKILERNSRTCNIIVKHDQ